MKPLFPALLPALAVLAPTASAQSQTELFPDPDWTLTGWQNDLLYGEAIASAGDVNGDGYSDLLVAGPNHTETFHREGIAHLYLGSAAGLQGTPAWELKGEWYHANFGGGLFEAGDVDGDGHDDVFVRTAFYPSVDVTQGRIQLYRGTPTGLETTAAWTVTGADGHLIGEAVAGALDFNGDGFDDMAYGVKRDETPNVQQGRVWVHYGSPTGLDPVAGWTQVGESAVDLYGSAVGGGDFNSDGYDDLLVGADYWDFKGKAYLYLGSASGLSTTPAWTREATGNERLGSTVRSVGDVDGDGYCDALIGASGNSRVHLHRGGPSGLETSASWVRVGQSGEVLGAYSTRTMPAGDVNGDGYADVLLGSPQYVTFGNQDGRTMLFLGSATGLGSAPDWVIEGPLFFSRYGRNTGLIGDVNGDGLSDFYFTGFDGQSNQGRVFVYHGHGLGADAQPAWTRSSGSTDSRYGERAAFVGDVDGDGRSDAVIASPGFDGTTPDAGRFELRLGGVQGPTSVVYVQAGANPGEQLGAALAGGDVQGDGYDDVAVGSPLFDDGSAVVGRVMFAYGGDPLTLDTLAGAEDQGEFGAALAFGDFDGDGRQDLAVGEPGANGSSSDEGRVHVHSGGAAGVASVASWAAAGSQTDERFGSALAAGDADADGFDDLLVGAPGFANGELGEGRALLYFGSANGLAATPAVVEGDVAGAAFGSVLAHAGDVDGDATADFLISAPAFAAGGLVVGRVDLFLGSTGASFGPAAWSAQGTEDAGGFGLSVASAGDLNGDGFSDFAISAPAEDGGAEVDEGRVHVFLGAAAGPALVADRVLEADEAGAGYGTGLAGGGDLDGDGYADLLVGAPGGGPTADEGVVRLHRGNGRLGKFDGRPLRTRQLAADGATPIARGGSTGLFPYLRFSVAPRSAKGLDTVRMEWEAKPLGQPFDGTGILQGPAVGVGPETTPVLAPFLALDYGGPIRWRVRFASEDELFPRSPWFTLPGTSRTETAVRTPGGAPAGIDSPGVGAGVPRRVTRRLP